MQLHSGLCAIFCAPLGAVRPGGSAAVPSSRKRAVEAARRLALALKAFVVEDNVSIRDSLIEALSELTGIVTSGVAGSEKAAVAWLTDPSNEWDLAIIDLILEPGGSGLGVLHACRDREPGRKMVVLTGTANPEVRRQCEALGSDRVFDKSIETDALMDWCLALAQAAPRR
jgi:CheY-like chemotaxis protein